MAYSQRFINQVKIGWLQDRKKDNGAAKYVTLRTSMFIVPELNFNLSGVWTQREIGKKKKLE